MKTSISTILIVTFVAVSLLGTSIGAYFMYAQADKVLTISVYENLAGAAAFKAEHLKTYLSDIKNQAVQAATRVTFSKLLSTDKNSTGYRAALDSAQSSIDLIAKYDSGYNEAFLMGMDGKVVISSNHGNIGADKSGDAIFTNGLKGTEVKGVYISDATGKPQLGVSSPVFGSDGRIVGVYAARIYVDELNRIMADRTGLGRSGEMVLIDRQSYAITPLRYKEDAVLKAKIDTVLTRKCLSDMAEYGAANGSIVEHDEDVLTYKDYRNITVVGTHSYALPQAEWCVIAKIDESEALGQPRSELLSVFILFGAGMILATSIAIYLISSRISGAITSLADSVGKITKGDLNIRLKPSNISEIQSLTDSLNRILASLKLAILRTGMSQAEMGLGEALAAKKEAESRYESLFKSISEIVTVNKISPSGPGNFVEVNDYACQVFGYSKDELLSMGPQDLDESLRSKENTAGTVKDLLSGKPVTYTHTNRTKGGGLITVRMTLRLIEVAGEKLVISVGRDVTSEKEAEEKLRLYQRGFETSPNSKVLVEYSDGKPVILKVNESFTRYYGYTEKEAAGKNPSIVKSGLQGKDYYKKMWAALLDPKVGHWRDEIVNKRKDGSRINVLLIVNTFFDESGKATHFLADHVDITQEKKGSDAFHKVERALAETKELDRSALDAIPDSFFVCDAKGRFLSWNSEFRKATGYADEEISGMKATDFFSGADIARIAAAIRKGMRVGKAVVQANVITKSKSRLPTEFSGSVLKDKKGKIIGFAGVGRRLEGRKKE